MNATQATPHDKAQAADEFLDDANERPVILVTHEQHQVIAEMLELLPEDETLFDRGGVLCALNGDKLIPMTPDLLAERFSKLARFVTKRRGGDKPVLSWVYPPRWGVDAILDRQHWDGVRQVRAVVNWPVINQHGQVVVQGHDSASGALVVDAPAISLPASCSRDDAQEAACLLLDVVHDFPFTQLENAAAWLALALTLLTRYAHGGNVPMFVVEGNAQGVGKSLLLDVAATLVTGKPFPRAIFSPDADEMRKKITTLALSGAAVVMLDNVVHMLRGDALAAALTGASWYDRLLGTNRAFSGSLDVVMLATSNGAMYDADLARRVLPIKLHSAEEFPEKRTGFRYPRILDHVQQHRAELLTAALTIVKSWLDAGRPMPEMPAFGSFEDWSLWVRAPLVWLGLYDPLLTRSDLVEATPERSRFIDRETIARVLYACPSAEWRCLVALSRFAGLRVPSEALTLRWQDINWEQGRMLIHSPKTAHHGKATRLCPIFAELRPFLDDLFSIAPEGSEYVLPSLRHASAYRGDWKATNLRTTFAKIIRRAGIQPWPRLWHNLRASRQTELVEEFPAHVVSAWLGNTERIAAQHYLQVTEEHFERAAQASELSARKTTRALQAPLSSDAHQGPETTTSCVSNSFHHKGLGGTGFEPVTSTV